MSAQCPKRIPWHLLMRKQSRRQCARTRCSIVFSHQHLSKQTVHTIRESDAAQKKTIRLHETHPRRMDPHYAIVLRSLWQSLWIFRGERYWQTDRQRTNHNRILLHDWWRSYCARCLKKSKHTWAIVCGHSRGALTKPGYHSPSQVANPAIRHICTGSYQFTK